MTRIKKCFFLKSLAVCLLTIRLVSDEGAVQEQLHSSSNDQILESFLNYLFKKTSAGYVIYGEKPLYLGNGRPPECLMPGSTKHKVATHTSLALNILQGLPEERESENYILVNPGSVNGLPQNNELMLINRKAFLKVVQENLALFKYKLGHDITPEKLLKTLTDTTQSFSTALGREIALQGIVLGYGTDNSISFERASEFTEAIVSNTPTSPPNKLPPFQTAEDDVFNQIEENTKKKSLWNKVKEEISDFSYYTQQTQEDTLKIPFGYHKNTKETKTLFKKYKSAESKLRREITKKNFLNNFLKLLKVSPQAFRTQSENSSNVLTKEEIEILPKLIAKSIQYTFSEQISPHFISGMKDAQEEKRYDDINAGKETEFLEILREQGFSSSNRRENAPESQAFLQKIGNNPEVVCLIKKRLYFQTLKMGSSKEFITPNCATVKANFLIRDINNKNIAGVYAGERPSKLDLENVIPGLAHGIIGMAEGDVREVYIHPDFAYGTYSEFGGGKTIQIRIELVSIEGNSDTPMIPSLQPIDVRHFAPTIENCEKFKALEEKYSYSCGANTGHHYKKGEPLINLDKVIEHIPSTTPSPLSEEEKNLIAKLNWMIYQRNLILDEPSDGVR